MDKAALLFGGSLRIKLSALSLACLTACSAQSTLLTSQGAEGQVAGYRAIMVNVTSRNSRVHSNRDYQTVYKNLTAALTNKITPRTGLGVATDSKAAGTAVLTVDVREMAYTSQAARSMFGVGAGPAILTTEVTLTDGPSGKLLWQATTRATTAGQAGVFAASSTTQIEALSDQLVAELQARLAPPN